MLMIGVDPHKSSHTAVAVSALGELLGTKTVKANEQGFFSLLRWARGLGEELTCALEDGRHVTGRLERFLLARGERVLRVPPKLMGRERRHARAYGKSDPIDALAVARAALRERNLPEARLAGPEREIRLLVDHREDLVRESNRDIQRLRWTLHDLDHDLEPPPRAFRSERTLKRLGERLRRLEQTAQVRIAREQLGAIRSRLRRERELEREIAVLVRAHAPELLEIPGCGALTAAKLIGELGGIERFGSEAKLAMHAGIAPLDASSGRQRRHRLNRSGNRQLNCAVHRIAVTQGRDHQPAREFLARKEAEGKGRKEALRSLKRQLVRVIWKTLRPREILDADPRKMHWTSTPALAAGLT
jgi:transposase